MSTNGKQALAAIRHKPGSAIHFSHSFVGEAVASEVESFDLVFEITQAAERLTVEVATAPPPEDGLILMPAEETIQ